jgi:arsenate reductase
MSEKVVLFICVENACRSLMAESMFNANPPEGWRAISAGTEPASEPNPRTRAMLREVGLELPQHPPQLLTNEMMSDASVRVTMGCLDSASCPARLKALELVDWALPDPAKLDDQGFRRVRDDLAGRVKRLRLELVLRGRRRRDLQARPSPTS